VARGLNKQQTGFACQRPDVSGYSDVDAAAISEAVYVGIKNFPPEDVTVLYLRITYGLFREIGQCFAEADGAKKYPSRTPNVPRTCRHAA